MFNVKACCKSGKKFLKKNKKKTFKITGSLNKLIHDQHITSNKD